VHAPATEADTGSMSERSELPTIANCDGCNENSSSTRRYVATSFSDTISMR